MNEQRRTYKYFAFISYKSEDLKEAWRLKKRLDSYKLSAILCKRYKKERKPTYETFLDKTNIRAKELTQELQENLDNSHYLIVVCSPRSAQPCYVSKEIEYFTRNGREHEMFKFIIESDPNDIEASFNPEIKKAEERWSERDGIKREILGANIKEKDVDKMFFLYRWPVIGSYLQRERAYMQLVATLLDIDPQEIWSHEKLRIAEKIITLFVSFFLVLSALIFTWYVNRPVDVGVQLKELSAHNDNLPPLKDAIVTLELENEVKVDTIHGLGETVIFSNIPQRYIGKETRMRILCQDFVQIDTLITLSENVSLNMQRDSMEYGHVYFMLCDEGSYNAPIPNEEVYIDGVKAKSNQDGIVDIVIPLPKQKQKYTVTSKITNDVAEAIPSSGPYAAVLIRKKMPFPNR